MERDFDKDNDLIDLGDIATETCGEQGLFSDQNGQIRVGGFGITDE